MHNESAKPTSIGPGRQKKIGPPISRAAAACSELWSGRGSRVRPAFGAVPVWYTCSCGGAVCMHGVCGR